MADKTELLHLPQSDSTSLVLPAAGVPLITRGRREASSLLLRKKEPICLARVKLHDRWGLIDKQGHFVVEPVFHGLHSFSEGRAAFCDWIGGAISSDQFYKENHIVWYEHRYLLDTDAFGPGLIADPCSWGFLDVSGKAIAPLRFEFVRAFHGGLAGVRLNGKWGFINRNGDIAIGPRFDGVRDFHEGLCKVRLAGKHGLIDTNGAYVVEPYLHYLGEFSEGLACAAEVSGRYGYIDSGGFFAIEPKFARADNFHCGRARANDLEGNVGYIDKKGTFIYKCKEIEEAWGPNEPGLGNFIEDIAFVKLRRRFYVSECGHEEHALRDERSSSPLCSECSFCTHEFCDINRGLFLDADGCSILESHGHFVNAAAPFSDGLGMIKLTKPENWRQHVDEGRTAHEVYGFADVSGQVQIVPQFVSARPFRNGRAVVLIKGVGWRMIDKAGAVVGGITPGNSINMLDFKGGYAPICVDEKIGFIDTNGRTVIEPQFDSTGGFANSVAVVSESGKEQWRVLQDKDGQNHHRRDRKYGYVDSGGKLIIPYQFDDAGDFQEVEI